MRRILDTFQRGDCPQQNNGIPVSHRKIKFGQNRAQQRASLDTIRTSIALDTESIKTTYC